MPMCNTTYYQKPTKPSNTTNGLTGDIFRSQRAICVEYTSYAFTYFVMLLTNLISSHTFSKSSDPVFLTLPLKIVCVCALCQQHNSLSLSLSLLVFCHFAPRKKNRTNDAIRMLKRCTEIDATYVQAHLELFRLHRGSQAALILTDAIKANPDNLELRLAFGQWLLNNGM